MQFHEKNFDLFDFTTFFVKKIFLQVVDRNLELAQVETEECSLVTVLASDGYTCITSPVMSARSIPIHENSETEQEKEVVTQTSRQIIRCSGTDSGLSSEEGSSDGAVRNHLSSSSSSGSNDEMKNVVIEDCNSSDKSSYSEKQEKESAKETEADRLQGKKKYFHLFFSTRFLYWLGDYIKHRHF